MFNTARVKNSRFYYNKLFEDYIYNYPKLKKYFNYDPGDIESYCSRIEKIADSYDNSNRGVLADILRENNKYLGAGDRTLENIDKFACKGSVIIIGGQQPGLFTGPAFIIYKIITVLRLSKYIEEKTGTAVVPCFWNASDDKSSVQIDNLGIIDGRYRQVKLNMEGIEANVRLSNISLSLNDYEDVIKEMDTLMHGGLNREVRIFLTDILSGLSKKAGAGNGIGLCKLFSSIVLKLFSEWGPVIIDPSDKRLKEMGLNLLKKDIEEHEAINGLISSRGEKLIKYGYHAQVDPQKDTLDFFYNIDGKREKISIIAERVFRVRGKDYNREELLELAKSDPSAISWNVVLRPLIQDSLFPVAATVCGPGEVSYFAQFAEVYKYMGIELPVIYPRYSATIIESRIEKILEKPDMADMILSQGQSDAVRSVLRREGVEKTERLLEGLQEDINKKIEITESKIKIIGIDPENAFDRIKRNINKELKILSKKLYSKLKKQNQHIIDDIDRVHLNIFPNGNIQERMINIFYYLNKYGIDMIRGLYYSFEPLERGHRFLYFKRGEKNE